jgi:hypothetical protein
MIDQPGEQRNPGVLDRSHDWMIFAEQAQDDVSDFR